MAVAHLPEDVRSAIRFFAFYLANGTVSPELIAADYDYRPHLVEYGSELELAFAIFLNVLEVDEDGKPTNSDHATRRAAEWIRSYNEPDYRPDPPLEPWEVELY